ncbi:DUF5977 domain-containing protein [Nubsella zeaxanthinifaciens]|uniref:DUF5977 domain-containing protein n=1 Tax=Nubsella zeaxanthinifaciens TaxID=392412 RepID=UPI000DE2EC46|nr:DUF5977 domain-containing protein [Nubsella zeaxanthinifaciens]
MKNQGTLVGAPVRINDDRDQYPVALQSEVRGGHHKRTFFTELASFPAHLKEAGMTCYIAENGKTYQLANDLVTWNVYVTPAASGGSGGNGSTSPGTGGNNNSSATIISGNFGQWTAIQSQSASIFDKQIDLQYKLDLSAFPDRAVVFICGQFGLNSAFVGTTITLGTLPVGARPKAGIKKWMCCKGVELYFVVETGGAVKLVSKDGFNLPVASAGTENDPYFIDVFYNPDIAVVVPTTYTYTRTENFTKNNCDAGSDGSIVPFSKAYTSNVSLADATAIAMADPNYNVLGQANANAGGTCSLSSAIVTLELTSPDFQTGAYNYFGVKVSANVALNEAVTINYAYQGGGSGSITLPAGSTSYDPGTFPIQLGAADTPLLSIASSAPAYGATVTQQGTGTSLTLNTTYNG